MKYWILGTVALVVISFMLFNAPTSNKIAKNGDTVIIDFVGTVDGVAFDGGAAQNFELVLGSKSFVDTFEDQIVGMKIGETKNVNVTFPTNYAKELAGKKAVFKTTLKDIK